MNALENRPRKITPLPDEEIDTSDIPELDEMFFANARVVRPRAREEDVRPSANGKDVPVKSEKTG